MARRSQSAPDSVADSEPAAETRGDASRGLTLDELAEESGVPARTIRFYQSEKLLPKPSRDPHDARMVRYNEEHVERLRLVGELRDRGLKLPAIRTLLDQGDASTRIADWLGLDASLRGVWRADAPRLLDPEELAELLEGSASGTRGMLEEAGLLRRQGAAWLLPVPGLFDLTLRLARDGIRLDLVLEAGSILQRHLGKAADELIELFVAALGQGFGGGTDTATLVEALRPAAGDAAQLIFHQQLEHAIDALLADTKRLGRR